VDGGSVKIRSGGQTGVDRAALDVGILLGLDWGGWAPMNWKSEPPEMFIPPMYRQQMRECNTPGFEARTDLNVRDNEATLVLYRASLSGGTARTLRTARSMGRQVLEVPLAYAHTNPLYVDPEHVHEWVTRFGSVNVAGPRESKCPGIHLQAMRYLLEVFSYDARLGRLSRAALATMR
jgi:hypothetical protein